jgi:hypothetical protein
VSVVVLCTDMDRRVLLRAHRKGMANGDYVFLTPGTLPNDEVDVRWREGDEDDDKAKDIFRFVLYVRNVV